MTKVILLYLLVINVVLFATMGIDKYKARHGLWRIPEKRLFAMAILGGSLGGILGMRVFHHKTRHNSFRYGFPAIFITELLAVGLYSARGFIYILMHQ